MESPLDLPSHFAPSASLHVRVDICALVRLAVRTAGTQGVYLAGRLPHRRRMRTHDSLMLSIDAVVGGSKCSLAFRFIHVAYVMHLLDRRGKVRAASLL